MKRARAQQRIEAALGFEAAGLGQRAEREYRAALELAPRHAIALINLGQLYCARKRFADALPLFRRAVLTEPDNPIPRLNLAGALRELGDEAGAIAGYEQVLARDPAAAPARLNLANTLRSQGRLDEAKGHYQLLIARNPNDTAARWNLAALDGLAGDFPAAFAGFALCHRAWSSPAPGLSRWSGEPLGGRRIVLDADQGAGDTIMFCRFASLVREKGGQVILRGQAGLAPLFARSETASLFVGYGEPLPPADLWCPLADAPHALQLGAEALAAVGPGLLTAPADRTRAWNARLPDTRAMRIGLVWAGAAHHPDDRNRSMPLSTLLAPLRGIEGLELVSFQKGPQAEEAAGQPLTRADAHIADYADTAAALTRVDLLITVDTSVAHLAGAMGRPAWVLLPFAPDWRWMLERTDTPWYPSLTLLRQDRPRDWTSAMAKLDGPLRALAAQAAPVKRVDQ